MGLEIKIFYHSDQTRLLKDLNVEYTVEQCEVKSFILYDLNFISAIMPYVENGKVYSEIYTEAGALTSPESVKSLKKKIDNYFNCECEEILKTDG